MCSEVCRQENLSLPTHPLFVPASWLSKLLFQLRLTLFIIIPSTVLSSQEFSQCDRCGPEAGNFPPLLQISLLPVTPEMYSFKEQAEQGFHTANTHLRQPYTVFDCGHYTGQLIKSIGPYYKQIIKASIFTMLIGRGPMSINGFKEAHMNRAAKISTTMS